MNSFRTTSAGIVSELTAFGLNLSQNARRGKQNPTPTAGNGVFLWQQMFFFNSGILACTGKAHQQGTTGEIHTTSVWSRKKHSLQTLFQYTDDILGLNSERCRQQHTVSTALKPQRSSPSFTPTCKLFKLIPGLMTSPSFSPVLLQPSLIAHPSSGGTTAPAAD